MNQLNGLQNAQQPGNPDFPAWQTLSDEIQLFHEQFTTSRDELQRGMTPEEQRNLNLILQGAFIRVDARAGRYQRETADLAMRDQHQTDRRRAEQQRPERSQLQTKLQAEYALVREQQGQLNDYEMRRSPKFSNDVGYLRVAL